MCCTAEWNKLFDSYYLITIPTPRRLQSCIITAVMLQTSQEEQFPEYKGQLTRQLAECSSLINSVTLDFLLRPSWSCWDSISSTIILSGLLISKLRELQKSRSNRSRKDRERFNIVEEFWNINSYFKVESADNFLSLLFIRQIFPIFIAFIFGNLIYSFLLLMILKMKPNLKVVIHLFNINKFFATNFNLQWLHQKVKIFFRTQAIKLNLYKYIQVKGTVHQQVIVK